MKLHCEGNKIFATIFNLTGEIGEFNTENQARGIVKRVNKCEELENQIAIEQRTNKIINETINKVSDRLEEEKALNRELTDTLKTVLFLIGGHFHTVDDIEDIEAIKYNSKNAIQVIKKALEKAQGAE